jgi:hypothetical protein
LDPSPRAGEEVHVSTARAQTRPLTDDELTEKFGVKCVRVVVRGDLSDVYKQVRVLETRRDRRLHRRRAHERQVRIRVAERQRERIRVRTWRQDYPWFVRYPNLGRVVWWSMVALTVFLFIKAPG